MLAFVVRKALSVIPVLLAVSLMVLLLLQQASGDIAQVAVGPYATEEIVGAMKRQWGLDQPLYVQYGKFIASVVQGDLGKSFTSPRTVTAELAAAFPNTLKLSAAALLIAVVVAVPIGVTSAIRRNSLLDYVSMLLAVVGLSMPMFWSGIVMIILFSHYIPLFPSYGTGTWRHLVLPALNLAWPCTAMLARVTRSSMLDVLQEDYMRTARAKGLSGSKVVYKHALKNAFIPVITAIGLLFGLLLGGTILTEQVFAWPGVGALMIKAILARDLPVVRGAVMLIATCFVLINALVDISYAYLDPRIRYS